MLTLVQFMHAFSIVKLSTAERLIRSRFFPDHRDPDKPASRSLGDARFDVLEVLEGMVKHAVPIRADSPVFETLLAGGVTNDFESRLFAHAEMLEFNARSERMRTAFKKEPK